VRADGANSRFRSGNGKQRSVDNDSRRDSWHNRLHVSGTDPWRRAGFTDGPFGLVLYAMATGHHAFSGSTPGVITDAILNRAQVPPRQWNPGLPSKLEAIIGKALEKDRPPRYQSAAEMRGDLQKLKQLLESGRLAAPLTGRSGFRLGAMADSLCSYLRSFY
jgi:serine/threonine protein kinase